VIINVEQARNLKKAAVTYLRTLSQYLSGNNEEKPKITSIKAAAKPSEIKTWYLQNINQARAQFFVC
jgi:hypothetical protein